ncbi:dephospho-CoA kinase [Cochleicola gelatinilyticus]|uniref:Dephospho-CoA kinase n=1 Tax=Cochleicola gelatinilyticus TaxID=1763537 RepID=A0A167HES4_9FLAO|nr:dephospho-CoA kinase [Cochleicola gelatinilyticus]OAB78531.1 dephospho-CoA kinase [Cochleicola gelatinilyticus]
MKILGLTGGIGSGKTTVAKMFMELGVPVYIADDEARALTNSSKLIREQLIKLLGDSIYTKSGLDRAYVGSIVFKDAQLLEKMNKIIHPEVAKHFQSWVEKQHGTYCLKEAAILFENGGYKSCDATVLVTAPVAMRLERVMQRDATTKDAILERMDHQWSDDKKAKMADFVIENIDLQNTKKRVLELHQIFSQKTTF